MQAIMSLSDRIVVLNLGCKLADRQARMRWSTIRMW